MKYSILLGLKYHLKTRNVPNYVISRYASTGLGLWKEELTTKFKHEIEKYWKDKIHISNNEKLPEDKKKFYVLSMFPYPSGSLHMGHVRVYTISDSVARFHRMQGKNVIHPMGWDAFGLPAENAAIERQIDPAEWTEQNIQNMREQLFQLGCSFDTHREFATCNPEYYRWTQELFLKLYENDMLYQKETFVNWDPIDQTVLADEQVDENGISWRSGALVEKKLLKQWFVKTTVFAESLLEGLKDRTLKEWKDIIKIQEHWIGECKGTNIDFKLISDIPGYPKSLTLWTDKPEFIENAKFLAISNKNLLAKIEKYGIQDSVKKLKAKVINPFTNEELPIYVTSKETLPYETFRDDYLGIPCTSEADIVFCDNHNIKYEEVPVFSTEELQEKRSNILRIAKERKIGGYLVSSKLRDWLISRQRYWGTPIPIIHCETCGSIPVPREQLPVILPKISRSTSKRNITLKNADDWVKTSCPKCNRPSTRETDTMDTFVDSSWYFMRYIDAKNTNEMFSTDEAFRCLPVDLYIGGKEHAVLHLYYARFINHFLYHLGMVPTKEPFKQLLVQGMVMGQSYCTKDGKYLKPTEVEESDHGYLEKATKQPVETSWEKMSKSKHNGVDPSEMFSEYSTDTVRLLMLGDVAPTSHRNWSKDTFPGILNWQKRLWKIVSEFISIRTALKPEELANQPDDEDFLKEHAYMFDSRNYYVHGVTFNITGSQQLSVALSKMQGLTNALRRSSMRCIGLSREFERALAVQIIMLAPLAPSFASELWAGFCSAPNRISSEDPEIRWDRDVLEQRWPEVDMEYELKVRIKVNNKDYSTLRIPRRQLDIMTEDEVLKLALEDSRMKKHLEGRKITRVIFYSEIGAGAKLMLTTKKNVIDKVSQEKVA